MGRLRAIPILFVFGAILSVMDAPAASADSSERLFGHEAVQAWLDLRLATVNGEAGWRDGGFGKLRYGNGDSGPHLAQAALLWTPRLADTVTGHALFQYTPDAESALSVSEAYVRWKPVPTSSTRLSLRVGQMFPPVSMEHDGPGWTTTRTLTPSAVNAWIGEEVLVTGTELTVQKRLSGDTGDHDLSAAAGLFVGNDTSGTVLTWRGWALHDLASGHNSRLKLPNGGRGGYTTVFRKQAQLSDVAVDLDERAGQYLRLGWRPPAGVAFNMTVYNNPGNPTLLKDGQYGWATRFANLGMAAQPGSDTEILAQYMIGTTKMGPIVGSGRRAADIAFDAAYLLVTRQFDNGSRLTGRIDYFAANDHSMPERDNNNELGYAATLAWLRPVDSHLSLVTEVVHVVARRPARATQDLAARQSQTQFQLAMKWHP